MHQDLVGCRENSPQNQLELHVPSKYRRLHCLFEEMIMLSQLRVGHAIATKQTLHVIHDKKRRVASVLI